jgi:fructan beta-fructosidase
MKNKLTVITLIALISIFYSCSQEDIIMADFEGNDWGEWTVEGEAFGPGPTIIDPSEEYIFPGHLGKGMVRSSREGTGILTSPPFIVQRKYLVYLFSNRDRSEKIAVRLLQDGNAVQSSTGNYARTLNWFFFDLKELEGEEVQIQIIDDISDRPKGRLQVDHIYQTNTLPFIEKSMDLTLDARYLNLPVRTGERFTRMKLIIEDRVFTEFDIELADSFPEFYVFIDVSRFKGQDATLQVQKLGRHSKAFDFISQDNVIKDAEDLYREPLRQQIHFSTKRGWINDPNGLVYYDGEYHMYYQLNPYGWYSANKHWGHAVSTDLVHWEELPVAIYPYEYGDWVFSGGAVMDYENTAGFKTGDEDVIIASYTSTGRGEVIAYSNDRGRTFTEYEGNPVYEHRGRDPKIIWFEPGGHWVMVVYHEEDGKRWIAFLTSDNLKDWTFQSKVEGYFECPELFELPVDGNPENKKWILYGASGSYAMGSFDGKIFTPESEKLQNNYGNCFYASQTFSNIPEEDGRRIQIAWGLGVNTPGMPFNQCMLFPVKLTLKTTNKGIRMFSEPVKEIALLHKNEEQWPDELIESGSPVIVPGELFHIIGELKITPDSEFGLKIHGADVIYNAARQELSCMDKKAPLKSKDGSIHMEIIVDRNTIEIFCNHGEVYMPMARDLSKPYGVEFISNSGETIAKSLQVSELESIWK